jgi:hypothetical protein
LKVIVLKGLASLPAKRFRSLAAVAWKTLHAFAGHCKSASGDSTACRGKPRIHADLPTPGSAATAPAGRAPNGHGSKPGSSSRKRNRRQRPVRSAADVAKHSIRPRLPCPHPSAIRADRPPPERNRHLAGKVCLKSNTNQPTPPAAQQPAPRPAGPPTCMPERNQPAPDTCSTRARTPARPTPRGWSTGIAGPARPRPGSCSPPAAAGAGTQARSQGHRERR